MVAYKKEKNSHYVYISTTTFGILAKQIKTKRIFLIVEILKAL
jgi:hypothetical protein